MGFRYKLTTPVPCEADPVQQAAFLAKQLQPLLAQAQVGQAVAYFADAAHPTHNARSTRVWIRTGQPRPLLPPYSSYLNLIERLWKFLRQRIINP